MNEEMAKDKIGSVMVVGGGIGGMQASLDLADSGFYVYLVEKNSAIGGVMAQLDKTFPTNDCSMCIMGPKLVECGRHLNIETLTLTDIVEVTGEPGNFQVKLLERPRYIDMAKCTACGECEKACPISILSLFDCHSLIRGCAIEKLLISSTPKPCPVPLQLKREARLRVRLPVLPM
jgi:heterodisulfide reductase subunit A-like polyferredoxin